GDEVDAIESGLLAGPSDLLIRRFLVARRALHALRRVLCPLRETFTQFTRRDHPLFSKTTQVYFQDVHDHLLRILDALEVQRDKVGGTTDAYLMMMSNRSSLVLGTIGIVVFIAGILGTALAAWAIGVREHALSALPFLGALAGAFVIAAIGVGAGRKR